MNAIFYVRRSFLDSLTLHKSAEKEHVPALTAENAVVAEKLFTDKQAIARAYSIRERQHVGAGEIQGFAYSRSDVNPICLRSLLRVLSALGDDRFSLVVALSAWVWKEIVPLQFDILRTETACVTTAV